ncbi:hypothetical protein ACFQVC_02540 [Streptomyces monticola]|uniref:Uncharacterized protein n=1 Tax=Streptomyces monticola TaxID=2666263 RepID=A0ABW2JC38_9ACTN
MSGRLTAGQRRIIGAADDVTGRVTGSEAQLAGLVRLGLAFRHARPPRAHFLTPAGHRVRAELRTAAPPPAAPATDTGAGVFAARTGTETDGPASGPVRRREVHSAWQGLVELRRMTNPDGATDRPCAWERGHLVQAAALALEAADCHPASPGNPGYQVFATPQPEAVGVRVVSRTGAHPAAGSDTHGTDLKTCAAALEQAGWQVGEYGERGGGRSLLASPRRV